MLSFAPHICSWERMIGARQARVIDTSMILPFSANGGWTFAVGAYSLNFWALDLVWSLYWSYSKADEPLSSSGRPDTLCKLGVWARIEQGPFTLNLSRPSARRSKRCFVDDLGHLSPTARVNLYDFFAKLEKDCQMNPPVSGSARKGSRAKSTPYRMSPCRRARKPQKAQ